MVLIDRPAANTKFIRKEARKVAGAAGRYRAGHAPGWEDKESDDEEETLTALDRRGPQVQIEEKKDRRLERIKQAQEAAGEEDTVARRRHFLREAEVLEPAQHRPEHAVAPEHDEEDERELAERRRAAARRRKVNEALQAGEDQVLSRLDQPQPVQQGDSGSESEYEEVTESESEDGPGGAVILAKPTFVARDSRVTALEQKKREVEEEQERKKKLAIIDKRREDTRRLVVEEQLRNANKRDNDEAESENELPDDDDVNLTEEFERWKLRELHRIKRYKEELQKMEAEKLEVERRRNLTDDQRKQENIDYDKKLKGMGLDKRKAKWNFMQKYYHKGAYYQDTAEKGMETEAIYRRDIGHAVGSDAFNKELLPKAMQVRGEDFGKRGQVKHTHLVQEDTTYSKDASGSMMENPFIHTTFASTRKTQSSSQAFQQAENQQMFKVGKAGDVTPMAPGSAGFGTAGSVHKDHVLARPTKKSKT